MNWQKAYGLNWRARVATAIGRYEQAIGDGLPAHTDHPHATEVAIGARARKRLLDCGRSISIHIA